MHETDSIPDRIIRVLKAMVLQEFGKDLEEPVRLTPPPDPALGDFAFESLAGLHIEARLVIHFPSMIAADPESGEQRQRDEVGGA